MLESPIADLTNPRLWMVMLVWTDIGVFNKLIYYEAGERSGKAALKEIHGYKEERADRFHKHLIAGELHSCYWLPYRCLAQ